MVRRKLQDGSNDAAWYKDTNYEKWRRSGGEFIAVSDMQKFHLIKAAQKIQRLNLTHLEVYNGIKDQLRGKYKANDSEWTLGGAL
jgi:hypothetical protein